MTPRFYAQIIGDEPSVPTYDEAVEQHAVGVAGNTFPSTPAVDRYRRVLLDVGSVDVTDEDELRELILTVPLLHAVYTIGRRRGVEAALNG